MCTSERIKPMRLPIAYLGWVLLLMFSAAVMAAGPDTTGLVLYLPMENAQNPIDASADPTTVAVDGVLASADGQLGTQGIAFDGNAANRLQVAHAPKLEGMSTLTIEAWAYPRNIASYEGMCLVSKRIANQNADAYNLFIWTGQILEARINAGGAVNSTTILQDDTWYHIAFVFDAQAATGEKMKLYVNGVLEDSGDHTATAAQGSNGGGAPVWVGELDSARGFAWDGVLDEIGIWDIALTQEDVDLLMTQTKAKMLSGGIASNPTPGDGSDDVLRTTDLAWTAGEYAATHNVYFGSSYEDVNAADPGLLIAEGLARGVTSLDIARLDFGQTYYWRVDEVNGAPDFSVLEGDIWSFTVEPLAYAIQNVLATSNGISDEVSTPQKTVDGSGIDTDGQASIDSADMWLANPPVDEPLYIQYEFDGVYKLHEMLVWNYNVQFELVLGFGIKGVTVEYSENGTDWMSLGDAEFARATAVATYAANTVVDLGGVAARYVRLTVNSGWGMLNQYGLSEVRFMSIPAQARMPQPADGTDGIEPATTLSWRAGREAASHDVYLGTDPNDLALADTVDQASYAPGNLEFGNTYYWQIVEVNEAEAVSAWAGDVWSFSTQEYVLIDGFETYTDNIDAAETIFDTWIDGWVNDNGSTVGYFDAPFAEQTIVRSGRQSMPLQYDNTASPFYSEAVRTFDGPQDWTVNSADTLAVYFQGVPGPFAELASGTIVMGAAGADIWNAADEFRFAYKPLSGDGSMTALVESVANTNAWAKAGVMIRETLDAGSTFAGIYATPGNGCRYQARLTTEAAAVSDSSIATPEQIALNAPHWVKIERVGNAFNGYYSTDGVNWTAMAWNPQTIVMASDVYIGLALTSHAAGVLASAEFSGVATTGNVNGSWTVATIGPEQPEGNAAGPLYVALEDATGQTAMVSHPAGDAAVLLGGWNEWAIPLSEFAGVNAGRIEAMTIGVGDRANPATGGTGIIYVDDLSYGRPAATE